MAGSVSSPGGPGCEWAISKMYTSWVCTWRQYVEVTPWGCGCWLSAVGFGVPSGQAACGVMTWDSLLSQGPWFIRGHHRLEVFHNIAWRQPGIFIFGWFLRACLGARFCCKSCSDQGSWGQAPILQAYFGFSLFQRGPKHKARKKSP